MKVNLKYFIAICVNSTLPLLVLYVCYKIPEWFYFSYCESELLQYMGGESFLWSYVRWGAGILNLVLLIIHFVVNAKEQSPLKKRYNLIAVPLTLASFYVVWYTVYRVAEFILGGGIHTQ